MLLSVIIPTRNRCQWVGGTIKSILNKSLSPDNYEIIVVDNGSTDSTKDVVDSFIEKFQNVHYYYEETPGLHVGRHRGLKQAKGDILVYADDDIEAFPTWLEGIAEAFEDKNVMLVGGKNLPKFEAKPPDWIMNMWFQAHPEGNMLGYLSLLDLGDSIKEINPYYVFGCNFSIRKSVLSEAGGFHPDAMPQELIRYRGDGESYVSQYILEHGYKTLYHPKASVFHMVPKARLSENYFLHRSFNQGISDSYAQLRRNGGPDKTLLYLLQKWKWRFPLHKAKMFLKSCIQNKSLTENDFITLRLRKANRSGYLYHQNEVRKDQELLKWVMKKDYLDGQSPTKNLR
jgi:glycosyltransferase involved in cell wall biosynthesis